MARRCDICGKMAVSGNNVSHSKRRTKRVWRPNIQRATLEVAGTRVQLKVCTRCLRDQKKAAA